MQIALVGYGAIGRAIVASADALAPICIRYVLVRPSQRQDVQEKLNVSHRSITAVSEIPSGIDLLLECAGHEAVRSVVLEALRRGIETGIISTGALADAMLAQDLERAAEEGKTQVHLIPGAMAGIDALSAARQAGLTSVIYRGRKPPSAWRGTAAELRVDLSALKSAEVFFSGTAREAALSFPKNANVAATVSLAGLGFDRTRVELIADPAISRNMHELEAEGIFGKMKIYLAIAPLEGNLKTSALTVWSALRFLQSKRIGMIV